MGEAVRIAMWSGPRNISTALMRSFGNRTDTVVVDEPLYAYYLLSSGAEHPGRDAVLASQPTSWQAVADDLLAPLPDGVSISYQKHMAHHLLDEVDRSWLDGLRHAFLIRDPAAMVTSLVQVLPRPALLDTGLPQQVELFERLTERGNTPPVVDADDLLRNPRAVLEALCAALGIGFSERMLSWPAGPRSTEGVWARWWYDAVVASTGFAPHRPRVPDVPEHARPLVDTCLPYYQRLAAVRITG